jgi:hypothetical protein
MNKCPVQHNPQDLHKVLPGDSLVLSIPVMPGIISQDEQLYKTVGRYLWQKCSAKKMLGSH